MNQLFKDFILEVKKDLYKKGPFWSPSLSTLDCDGFPSSRIAVLREVLGDGHNTKLEFIFHTDRRSKKWNQITADSRACLTFYCPKRRWQMRLKGHLELINDSQKLKSMWSDISKNSQAIYGLTSAPATPSLDRSSAMSIETSLSFKNFGAIKFRPIELDSLVLKRSHSDLPYHERTLWHLESKEIQIVVP